MADAAPGQLTRQQLYDQIRESSKDEYILSEMKRLGYWDADEGMPSLSEELITRKGELSRELNELMKTQHMLADPEKALAEFRKQRMKEAKEKREETKQRRAHERHQRALKWFERQQNEITYAGDDVSIGLNNKQLDMTKLRNQGLPVIHNSISLANTMGITLNELRFLSFNRKTSKVNHYQRFLVAKKTGGQRLISAPMPRLKRVQYWVLENILLKLPTEDCAHGFVPGKSIVSNSEQHVGQDVVINLDMKDFFPTIDYRRIKGLFLKMGYSEEVAIILALLCSEPDIDQLEMDGETWNIAKSKRFMPQGAPTSPMISNLICRKLDKRLKGLAAKFGYNYTRYADDLTFSASGASAGDAAKLLRIVGEIIEAEGFVVHPEKTRIMRKNRHQEVTGITVNEKLTIDRKTLKRFRALLFQIEKDGPEGKKWGAGNILSSIQGYANYVAMISKEKGEPLKKRVAAILEQHSAHGIKRQATKGPLSKKHFRKMSAEGQSPRQDWWNASAPKDSPVIEKTDQQIKAERKEKYLADKKETVTSVPVTNTAPAQEIRTEEVIDTPPSPPELTVQKISVTASNEYDQNHILFLFMALGVVFLAIIMSLIF